MLRNYFSISVCSIGIFSPPFRGRMDGRGASPTDFPIKWPGCTPKWSSV